MLRPTLRATMIALAVGACTGTTAPTSIETNLLVAHTRWNAAGLHDYSYDAVFGGSWFNDSLRVDVRADTVAAVRSNRNSTARPQVMTISGMLSRVQNDLASGTLKSATFDRTYGFPIHVTGGQDGVPDTDYSYGAVNLTPAP